ncbi:MAG: hypothetical protein QF814_07860 [Candidatus Marinimicrobia bacterium]|nr:hypothetical protein [Candidatus Neomarinimicrobiota bacterium]
MKQPSGELENKSPEGCQITRPTHTIRSESSLWRLNQSFLPARRLLTVSVNNLSDDLGGE